MVVTLKVQSGHGPQISVPLALPLLSFGPKAKWLEQFIASVLRSGLRMCAFSMRIKQHPETAEDATPFRPLPLSQQITPTSSYLTPTPS